MKQDVDPKTGVESGAAQVSLRPAQEADVFVTTRFQAALDLYVTVPVVDEDGLGTQREIAFVRVYALIGGSWSIVSARRLYAGRSGRLIAERGGAVKYRVTVQSRYLTDKTLSLAFTAYGFDPGAPSQWSAERVCFQPSWFVAPNGTSQRLNQRIDGSRYVRQVSGFLADAGEVRIRLMDADKYGNPAHLLDEVLVSARGQGFVFDYRDSHPHASQHDGRYAKNALWLLAVGPGGEGIDEKDAPHGFFTAETRQVAADPGRPEFEAVPQT